MGPALDVVPDPCSHVLAPELLGLQHVLVPGALRGQVVPNYHVCIGKCTVVSLFCIREILKNSSNNKAPHLVAHPLLRGRVLEDLLGLLHGLLRGLRDLQRPVGAHPRGRLPFGRHGCVPTGIPSPCKGWGGQGGL